MMFGRKAESIPALDEVTRRLNEYRVSRDPRLIMADEISALMNTLMTEVDHRGAGQAKLDSVAAQCLAAAAAAIWYTAEHTAPEQRVSIQRDAVGLAAMLHPPYPELLPPELARLCASLYGDGPIKWNLIRPHPLRRRSHRRSASIGGRTVRRASPTNKISTGSAAARFLCGK